MRAALLTFTNSPAFNPLVETVLPNRDRYCARHGYTHLVRTGIDYRPGWFYSLQRFQYVHDRLEQDDYEFIWVLNIAAVIMRSAIAFPSLLPLRDYPESDVFITRAVGALNAGSYVVRRSPGALGWLRYMIRESLNKPHEQDALMATHEKMPGVLCELPVPSINSYRYELYPQHSDEVGCPNDYRPGHFVVHFPGLPYEQRMTLVREMLVEAE